MSKETVVDEAVKELKHSGLGGLARLAVKPQLASVWDAARNEALEEAAQLAQRMMRVQYGPSETGQSMAAAIRALKGREAPVKVP